MTARSRVVEARGAEVGVRLRSTGHVYWCYYPRSVMEGRLKRTKKKLDRADLKKLFKVSDVVVALEV